MRQAHLQVLSSDAVSARTEVGTQPCYRGGLLSHCQVRSEKASGTGIRGRNLGRQRADRTRGCRRDTRLQKGHELRKQPVQRPRDEKEQTELRDLQADWPGWGSIELSCIYYLAVSNPSLPTSLVLSLWIYLHSHCHPPN